MKYAVIQLSGKQYKLSVGEEAVVAALEGKAGEKIEVGEVLMVADGDKIQVGAPLVKGAQVTLQIVESKPSEKIRVAKYKAKSRYRRVYGHRQLHTTVKVLAIQ